MKLSVIGLCVCLGLSIAVSAQNWPSFRGAAASGVADGTHPPTTWDVEKATNLLWKTPIPGLGHSSPVVWGDRIFITTAISSNPNFEFTHGATQTVASAKDSSKYVWRVYCVSKNNGKVLWERTAYEGVPKTKRHVKASQANPTPATDGKYVVAFFGSQGLYCYDVQGKLQWKQDLGLLDGGWSSDPGAHWGFGSSPIIYKDVVIIQCDTQKNSFLAAYKLTDGKRVWLTPRDEDTSWSTPTVFYGKLRDELIVSGTKYYRGYDPLTGKELWRLADGADVKIPTPVADNGVIFIGGGSSQMQRVFYAVRPGGTGEITMSKEQTSNEYIVWRNRAAPHLLTPLIYGGFLYVCTDNGVLSQYNIQTGELTYRERIGGRGISFSASPVGADGVIYFTSEDGDVFIIKAGANYELLSTNTIGEVVLATPAISERMLIFRGQSHLFGIGGRKTSGPSQPLTR